MECLREPACLNRVCVGKGIRAMRSGGNLPVPGHAERIMQTPRPEAQRSSLGPAGALLFDLRDVLFDDTLWSRWLYQLVARMGHAIGYDAFWEIWEQAFQRDVVFGGRELHETLAALLARLGLSRGQIDEVWAASLARQRQSAEATRALPGVKLALAQLHACGWTIGVFGNMCGSHADVQRCLERLELASSVDHAFSASELALKQPNVSPYVQAARGLRTAPAQTVFISASRYALELARSAGLQTVGVQLRDAGDPSRCVIEHIGELARILRPVRPHRHAS